MIFSAPFINISASQHRKIILELEIPNTENLETAKKALLDEVRQLSSVADSKSAEVIYLNQKLGVYNLQVKFDMKPGESFPTVRSEAIVKLKKRLDDEGIQTSLPPVTATTT